MFLNVINFLLKLYSEVIYSPIEYTHNIYFYKNIILFFAINGGKLTTKLRTYLLFGWLWP